MTNLPPPELTPERPVRSDFTLPRTYRVRRMITCAVLALLICGSALGAYLWNRAPAEIPTIRAEGPLKQKPEQPGGIDIPNQDVLAYQQIDNSGNKTPQPEHLLPPPETPQTTSAQQTAPDAPAPPAPKVETLLAPPSPPPIVTTVTPEKKMPKPSQAGAAPPPAAAPRSAVVAVSADSTAMSPSAVEPAAAPEAEAPAPAANDEPPASAPAKPGRKGFRVQLASFPDIDTARSQMAHMEKKYASQLGEAKLHLAKADLGPRGIYYRVQSNPITDTEARDICGALSKLKAGCIVVKP